MVKNQARQETALAISHGGGGIVTVTIDRPAKKNALTLASWRALAETFSAIGSDPGTRAIVLAGAGKDFCAGADIAEFDSMRSGEAGRAYEEANLAAFDAIRRSPAPTVAAIGGTCFGGGFGIAAACDLRIASRDARFAIPAARLGLAYPQAAMGDILAACGAQMARYLCFSGLPVDAARALGAGFLLEAVDGPEQLAARAREIALAIAAGAPLSIRAAKAAMLAMATGDADDAARAGVLADATFASDDYAEGRLAFRERRPPRFAGR